MPFDAVFQIVGGTDVVAAIFVALEYVNKIRHGGRRRELKKGLADN